MTARIIKHFEFEDEQKSRQNPELFDLEMTKGDVVVIDLKYKKKVRLFIACPRCGISSFTGTHKINVEDNVVSAHPSLVMQCCGWHGWLKKNKFSGDGII